MKNSSVKKPTSSMSRIKSMMIVILLIALPLLALAQTEAGTPNLDLTQLLPWIGQLLTPVMETAAGKYGWVVQVLVVIGALRVAFKPVMFFLEQRDPVNIGSFERGPAYKVISFLLDFGASIKVNQLPNMKKTIGPTILMLMGLAGTLALPLLTTGCKTVTDASGNSLRVVDSNKVDRAALILRNVVGDATAAGELLDPGSVQYLHLVVNVLDSAIAATNTAPAALRKTLATLPIKELQNVWAKIAINNAIGAYEIFFQDKLAGVIGGNYAAVTLLTAFRDGIASALPQQGGALERGAWSVEFGRASGTRNDSKLNGSASSGPADRWPAPGAMTPPCFAWGADEQQEQEQEQEQEAS